jgi:hypothetical protein
MERFKISAKNISVLNIVWWSRYVNVEEGTARRVMDSRNSKPNQNHSGAAMHTAAARERSISINRKQRSTLHWHT